MKLLGLTGPAGAGKDEVAKVLVNYRGFAKMSFAGPIKDALVVMLGLDRATLEDRNVKEQTVAWIGQSPRRLMQTLGTEWGRQLVHPDLWIHRAERLLNNYRRISHDVVITDVRFDNEADWLRAQGGELWHIARKYDAKVAVLHHASENGVAIRPGSDSLIRNDEGLDQLADQVRRALAGECLIDRLIA